MAVLGTTFRYDLLLLLLLLCRLPWDVSKLFFDNFPSRSLILMIFTFLKMALKFIGSSSLLEECGSKNKVTTDDLMNSGAIHKFRGHP